jgi:hypothetical protein
VIAISSVTRLEPIRKVVKGRATKEKCHLRERRRKKDDKNREKEKGMKDFMIWEVSKEATLADPDTPAKQDKGGSHLGSRSSSAKKRQSQKTVRRKPKKDRTN